MASQPSRFWARSVLLATAVPVLAGPAAAQERTVTPAQKQAYIDAAKDHNKRDAAQDAAFYAHQRRLHDDLLAARKARNWSEVKRLQGLQAQDQQHLARERTEDAQNQAHIKRVYGLKTD